MKTNILKIGLALGIQSVIVAASALPSCAQEPGLHISVARAAAIRECSIAAAKYTDYTWGNTEIYIYRTCMANHGQRE